MTKSALSCSVIQNRVIRLSVIGRGPSCRFFRNNGITEPLLAVTFPYRTTEKLTDLPSVDELSSAGLIDDTSIDSSIFGTSKFFKEQSLQKKDDLYKEIDKAIKDSPKSEE